MNLNDEESKVLETDPVYRHSIYYKSRSCDTCLLSRPPKASHCGACGHCVHGWDHHCVALNNCVGRRNMRAFVGFLMISTAFGIMLIASSLLILMLDRDYSPSTNYLRIGTLCGLMASGVTLFLTLKARFRNKVRVACLIIGFIISWIFTMVFARDFASILAAMIINVSLGYILVIKPMLLQYVDLVSRHLTTRL